MQHDEIQISLIRSLDDPELGSDLMQSKFGEFYKSFEANGVKVSPTYYVFDSANGGGGLVGEYLIPLAQAVGPMLGGALVAWLKGQSGRKVRVRIGELEIEARTVDDIEKLLRKIMELQLEGNSKMQKPKYKTGGRTKRKYTLWVVCVVILLTLWVVGEGLGIFDPIVTKQENTTSRQEAKMFADIPPSQELLECIDQKIEELKNSGGYFEPKEILEMNQSGVGKSVYYSAGDVFKRVWLWKVCEQKAKSWIINDCEFQSHASFAVCELQLNTFVADEFDRLGLEMIYVDISPGGAVGALKAVTKGTVGGVPLWRAMEMTNTSPLVFGPRN
jgi:hypothetical protein